MMTGEARDEGGDAGADPGLAADGEVELWDRRTGEREVVPAAEVVERLRAR